MNLRQMLFRWMYFVCGLSNTESYIGQSLLECLLAWYDLAEMLPSAPIVFEQNPDGSLGKWLGHWIDGEIVP
jgi:hypothetical protein